MDQGRTLYSDNYYTSVYWAHTLLDRDTYLVGTLHSDRKLNPKDTGVVVLKWRDRRDVLVLSTKHTDKLVTNRQRVGEVEKPKIISEFRYKAFIDLSDQMKAYSSCLRRGLKWYRDSWVANGYSFSENIYTASTRCKCQYANHKIQGTGYGRVTTFSDRHITQEPHLMNLQLNKRKDKVLAGGRCVSCYKTKVEQVRTKSAENQAKQSRSYIMFFEVHKCFIA